MVDEFEAGDPVLVRPYITTQPGGEPAGSDERAVQTWPATADLPEDGTRESARVTEPTTIVDPAAKTSALRRQRLVVLAGIGALAVAGAAGLSFLLPSGDDDPPVAAQPAPPAPGVTGSPAAAAPVASAATRRASSAAPPASRSPVAGRSATAAGPAPAVPGQAASPAPTSAAPSATLAPPPGTPRTGPITAAGGRCLNVGGLFATNGTPVHTAGCADISYQRWTVTSDGTLLVVDRCARVDADATVHLGGCDDQPAGQWRAGPHGSLVNPETGRCLTDPGAAATTVTVTACTGAANQTWKLP